MTTEEYSSNEYRMKPENIKIFLKWYSSDNHTFTLNLLLPVILLCIMAIITVFIFSPQEKLINIRGIILISLLVGFTIFFILVYSTEKYKKRPEYIDKKLRQFKEGNIDRPVYGIRIEYLDRIKWFNIVFNRALFFDVVLNLYIDYNLFKKIYPLLYSDIQLYMKKGIIINSGEDKLNQEENEIYTILFTIYRREGIRFSKIIEKIESLQPGKIWYFTKKT